MQLSANLQLSPYWFACGFASTAVDEADHGGQAGPAPGGGKALLCPPRQDIRRADISAAAFLEIGERGAGGRISR